MAWEIWRLQCVISALEARLAHAARLRHRQDILDRVSELREYLAGDPCLNEANPVKPGARRDGPRWRAVGSKKSPASGPGHREW